MPDIRLRRRHGLGLAAARRRAEAVAEELERDHAHLVQSVDWNDEGTRAEVRGRGFRGRFTLSEEEVGIDVELGLLARAFRGRVEQTLAAQLDEHFG